MTPSELKAKVAEVMAFGEIEADPEIYHSDRDDLIESFVRAVANGTCKQPRACARKLVPLVNQNAVMWYA